MQTSFNILLFLLNNLESSSFLWVTFGGKPVKGRCSSQAYFSMIQFLWVVVFLSSIFISPHSLWSIVQLPYTLLLCHIQNITSVNVFDSYKVIEVGMGYTEKRETSIQKVYQRLLQETEAYVLYVMKTFCIVVVQSWSPAKNLNIQQQRQAHREKGVVSPRVTA